MADLDVLPLFVEIAQHGKSYCLDWLGGIYPNFGDTSNPLIECFFTPFDPVSKERFLADQIKAGIAVGYLPALCLGQMFTGPTWENTLLGQTEKITVRLDTRDEGAIDEVSLLSLDRDYQFSPVSERFLSRDSASLAGLSPLDAGLKALSGKVVKGKQPTLILVSEIELLRYYYLTTSFMARIIFGGAFGQHGWSEIICNMIHEGPTFDLGLEQARFVYRQGFAYADVPVLARILFTGGKRPALCGATRVGKAIRAARINRLGKDALVHPRTFFPFLGRTDLSLQGRTWETEGGPVFLVSRIVGCSGPFPFKSISFCEEVGPGGKPAKPGAPGAYPGRKRPPSEPDGGGTRKCVSTSPPHPFGKKFVFRGGGRNFAVLQGMSICREKRKENTHRSGSGFGGKVPSLPDLSTGAPSGKSSSASPLSVQDLAKRPSAVAEQLDTFLEALQILAENKPEWCVNVVHAGLEPLWDPEREKDFSQFPIVPCEKRVLQNRQCSFMDAEQKVRRLLICAEIEVCPGHFVYLLEAQRRIRDAISEAQSPYKDLLPIALMRTTNYAPIEDEIFDLILIETVKKKTSWPVTGDVPNIIRDDARHAQGEKGAREIADRMIALVQRHCLEIAAEAPADQTGY
ncbi:hypothetical protein PQU96_10840 [Vogesella sp. LYT5W]|uniref:Uncharacterized protein n=1 Tax=Vogesella margarita TaxID=2984199 RepID=A0ABT5IPX3_9NEIS|nr:hypothetical protein [Vogesella margarita]MDC7714615.1 hypothetical protein [Vogesella margarita]